MGKKMKLPFIHMSKNIDQKPSSSPPWPWPSCGNIRTLSFRASNIEYDDSFQALNSIPRCSTTCDECCSDPVENVIRSLRSDRFFFEPERSSSLVSSPMNVEKDNKSNYSTSTKAEQDGQNGGIYEESEMLSMHSNNPYEDFRTSMEEMVEAHGLKEWEQLEGLLGCYLKMNGKKNHGYIVGAFVDLLVSYSFTTKLTNSSTTITSTCSSSSLSTHSIYSFPSSPLSLPSSSLTTPSILDNNDNDDYDHNSHCHVTS